MRHASQRVGVAIAALIGMAVFPLLGLAAGVGLGAVAFYVYSLVNSGYRPARAVIWGGLVSVLFITSIVAAEPLASGCLLGAAAVFLVPVLSRRFRRAWIGIAQE
jgi:hypothetical protein